MNLSLLKQKSFRLLVLGSFVSQMGTLIQQFALSLYVLKTTGSGALFATVIAAGMIPRLVFGPFGGVLADKLDRKTTFVSLDFVSGLVTLMFSVLYITNGRLAFHEILIYVMILQVINAFFEPAISTVIPSIVEKTELMSANAFISTLRQIAMVISPMVAGVLFGTYGLFTVMLINGISFMLSGASEMFIEMPSMEKNDTPLTAKLVMRDFKIGIDFIKGTKVVLAILLLGVFVNFAFSGMFSIILPYTLIQKYGVSESRFGIYMSIVFIGMVIGPALGALWSRRASTERIIIVGMSLVGAMMVGLSVYMSPIFSGIYHSQMGVMLGTGGFIFVTCLLIAVINVCISTLFQQIVPLEVMGRVGGVFSTLIMASSPVGQMLFGALLDRIDPYVGFAFAGICALIGVTVFKRLTSTKTKDRAIADPVLK